MGKEYFRRGLPKNTFTRYRLKRSTESYNEDQEYVCSSSFK